LAATPATPVSRLLLVALRLGTILQAAPFQCSTRVRVCTVVPTTVETLPTAQMSLDDSAEIPLSWLLAAPAGVGTGTTDQVPFQCSASAAPFRPLPTAHALFGLKATTPLRVDLAPPVRGGVGTMVQVLPFQCAASGLRPAAETVLVKPTAQASPGESALTASNDSSWCSTAGAPTWVQVLPFQRSVSMFKPSSSWSGAVKWPTAQASPELRTATAFSTFLVADGSTVGITVHPGAALAAVPNASSIASITDVSTSRRRRFRTFPDTAAPLLEQLEPRRSDHPPASIPRPNVRMVASGGTVRPGDWPDIGRCA
jgi:hypothetical protein